ncbi:pyridoxamine 5'-phosphate oxidase family protein [Yinghuangia sp. ASG 101]|uniref:pyridoxamine 5'-phosphate oxidase family protein n=1 Tax=Yinghuangia sp. ASG 101 TaxID=2896848 RepID=UPI001E5CA858|nr:pyridoxamine 5'-phosphate oxidase family protein [Yinghuangia sp. ASG 101]UGQ11114.1 pyridoxamine 5'-phosphate oxidase family protein [Yinghuangia sp. ASG 101]
MREQRRGRSIAMTRDEVGVFLDAERVCRVATIGADGHPHVVPLWFVWDGSALWLNSVVRSRRWADLRRDPRVSVVVDAGDDFDELRGVELFGEVEVASEVPRTSEPRPELTDVERRYAEKYSGTPDFVADGRHAWLRMRPAAVVSWDFRKNPALKPRRSG